MGQVCSTWWGATCTQAAAQGAQQQTLPQATLILYTTLQQTYEAVCVQYVSAPRRPFCALLCLVAWGGEPPSWDLSRNQNKHSSYLEALFAYKQHQEFESTKKSKAPMCKEALQCVKL